MLLVGDPSRTPGAGVEEEGDDEEEENDDDFCPGPPAGVLRWGIR